MFTTETGIDHSRSTMIRIFVKWGFKILKWGLIMGWSVTIEKLNCILNIKKVSLKLLMPRICRPICVSCSGPRFEHFSWSWSGLVPVFDIALGPGPNWSRNFKIFLVLVRFSPSTRTEQLSPGRIGFGPWTPEVILGEFQFRLSEIGTVVIKIVTIIRIMFNLLNWILSEIFIHHEFFESLFFSSGNSR